jgi:hypothetical protein
MGAQSTFYVHFGQAAIPSQPNLGAKHPPSPLVPAGVLADAAYTPECILMRSIWWRLVGAQVLETVTFVRVRGFLCRISNTNFYEKALFVKVDVATANQAQKPRNRPVWCLLWGQ